MASGQYGTVLQQVHRLFGKGTVAGLSEGDLLHRYVATRDEAAFSAMVASHGPMVLGVCRRLLDDPHDVEDAFQATFLVLVRRAGAIRGRVALGPWLYGVAHRVALRARSLTARRRSRERTGAEVADVGTTDDERWGDLRPILDEELGRLPESYRAPVVLCYLEGLTHEEAAHRLGWPLGTVKGRLARARDLLRGRLTRRGLALPAGGLIAALSRDAKAGVPSALLESTVKAAMKVAAGGANAGAVSATVAALMEGTMTTMFLTKLKLIAAGAVALGLVATGAGVLAIQAQEARPNAEDERPLPGSPTRTASVSAGAEPEKTQDTGAAPTFKSLVEARLRAAEKSFRGAQEGYDRGVMTVGPLAEASQRVLDAQLDLSDRKADRIAAYKAHRDRMAEVDRRTKVDRDQGRIGEIEANSAAYQLLTAEVLLAKEREGRDGARPGPSKGPNPGGKDDRSQAIRDRLDEPIDLDFSEDVPFEEVLKRIREATKGPGMPRGLPIYVDPTGLQEVEKTLESPVAIDLQGVPLKRALRLVLSQLGLTCGIKDGVLIISTEGSILDLLSDEPLLDPSPELIRGLKDQQVREAAEQERKMEESQKRGAIQ